MDLTRRENTKERRKKHSRKHVLGKGGNFGFARTKRVIIFLLLRHNRRTNVSNDWIIVLSFLITKREFTKHALYGEF